MKTGKAQIKQSMLKNLGEGKVDFTMKTFGIIRMLFCLRIAKPTQKLRKKARTRESMYFLKGREQLDKEMDIGFIIRHVRILRYFLKTVLDRDQRILLKLKTTEFIPSSEDESYANPSEFKVKIDKEAILDRYIDIL